MAFDVAINDASDGDSVSLRSTAGRRIGEASELVSRCRYVRPASKPSTPERGVRPCHH